MRLLSVLVFSLWTTAALALQAEDVVGTWRLVSSTRKVLATGEESPTYGTNPTGNIMYGRDGRMMVLIVHGGRPKPESLDKTTDADRIRLFRTMLAYAGTYSIAGDTITHSIDASWNEVWTGTKTMRDVKRDGDRLIYTTKPAPASTDGKMSVVTLVWERVR